VKLLLADQRVNPCVLGQYPLHLACSSGRSEVVKLLLSDKRIDPSSNTQDSVHIACLRGHLEVVNLLLADQRVVAPSLSKRSRLFCSSPLHPGVISFFFLRRSSLLEVKLLEQQHRDWFDKFDCGSVIADIEKIEEQRKALLNDHLLVSDLASLCLEYVPDLFCHLNVQTSRMLVCKDEKYLPCFSFANLSTL
jgi:hypothetical protein